MIDHIGSILHVSKGLIESSKIYFLLFCQIPIDFYTLLVTIWKLKRELAMASLSINKRKKSNGDIRYLALIRVSKKGTLVYNESRTFIKHLTAKAWGRKRLLEIEENGYKKDETNITVGELLKKYLLDKHIILKRTKLNVIFTSIV